ncbi:MAG: D-glycero-alpha-D-manno-heptose-1,7-bisphosphate 7-phosphatase [Flavobacteriales bacterium]
MNKNKAIFFDRDGVINKERGDYTWKTEDFHLLPEIGKFMVEMKSRGYLIIVITNQGGINKGLFTHEMYLEVEKYMLAKLAVDGVKPDAVYYCPHHPSVSNCICRKPDSLMVEKAIARFSIDPSRSFFIGDTERDTGAAKKCGVNGILIESNSPIFSIIEKIA